MTAPTAQQVIAAGLGQVGYHEGRDSQGWDNIQKFSEAIPSLRWSDGQPWCCVFASWCAIQAGAESLFPITASCSAAVHWYSSRGRWSEYPAMGAQVFYGSGGGAHTGIVVSFDADTIHTVEGNTNTTGDPQGDGVYGMVRQRRDPWVYGYGYPDYEGGILSADPDWLHQNPRPTPPAPASYVPFPGAGWFTMGRTDPIVGRMHARLVAVGCNRYQTHSNLNTIGSGDVASYEAWQRNCGYSGKAATWPPGPDTWNELRVPK